MSDKLRLFVDMDGTLAIFNPISTLEELYEPGYFEDLKPQYNVVDAVKDIIANHPDIEVFTLSAVLSDSKTALDEKKSWLDEYLPEIDEDHRIFCPCGEDKSQYIPGGIRPTDHLLDDYTNNLTLWEPPAKGIKLLNGINHTKGSWNREKLSFERSAKDLADRIAGIMSGIEHIQDTNLRLDPQAKITGDIIPVETFDKEEATFSYINPENGSKNYLNIHLTSAGWDYMIFNSDFVRDGADTRPAKISLKETVRAIVKEKGVALNDLALFDETVLYERVLQHEQKEAKGHKITDYAKQQIIDGNDIDRSQ